MLRPIGHLSKQRRRGGKGLVEELAPYCKDRALPGEVLGQISFLVEAIGYLDTYLIAFMQQRKSQNLHIQPHMQSELMDFTRLSASVVEQSTRLDALVNRMMEDNKVPEELEFRAKELGVHARRVRAAGEALKQFINYAQWTDDVYWFELAEFGKNVRTVEVHISPLSIAPKLQEALFSRLRTVVCTSATLDLRDDFGYWSKRVGLPLPDGRRYLTAVHPSPFDFKNRLLLLTPVDAPAFSERQPEEFVQYCTGIIRSAIISSGGGALVLFTSYGMLMRLSDELIADFAKAGINLLSQGVIESFRLLKLLTAEHDSV
jgi:ATP-dependent DNA helicase DinG